MILFKQNVKDRQKMARCHKGEKKMQENWRTRYNFRINSTCKEKKNVW